MSEWAKVRQYACMLAFGRLVVGVAFNWLGCDGKCTITILTIESVADAIFFFLLFTWTDAAIWYLERMQTDRLRMVDHFHKYGRLRKFYARLLAWTGLMIAFHMYWQRDTGNRLALGHVIVFFVQCSVASVNAIDASHDKPAQDGLGSDTDLSSSDMSGDNCIV